MSEEKPKLSCPRGECGYCDAAREEGIDYEYMGRNCVNCMYLGYECVK